MAEPKLTYGKNQEGRLVHIEDVPRGLECNCVCPECGVKLIARKGKKNQKHFAHANGADCAEARMTALHMLAQQIIQEEKKIRKPWFKDYCEDKSKIIEFSSVGLEVRFKTQEVNRRPDCVGTIQNGDKTTEVWIEVKVKHAIDEDKRNDIIKLGAICMEIDLSSLLTERYTKDSVRKALFDEYDNKEWINYPQLFRKNAIVKQKKEEEERIKREQEKEKTRLEEERRQKQLQEEKERLQKIVDAWMEEGSDEAAQKVINEIVSNPYGEENHYILKDFLVSYNNYIEWIQKSPKNKAALQVFYTILKYYNRQIARNVNLKELNAALCNFRYKSSITDEERIWLEELISLKIVRQLKYEYDSYRIYNPEFLKKTLQEYCSQEQLRNKCLKVISLEFRNIVGSTAKNFTELTREIATNDRDVLSLYLKVLDFAHNMQNKYPKQNIPGINDDDIVRIRKYVQENKRYVENSDCKNALIVAFSYIWGKQVHMVVNNNECIIGEKYEDVYYHQTKDTKLDEIEKLCLDIADKFEPIPEE